MPSEMPHVCLLAVPAAPHSARGPLGCQAALLVAPAPPWGVSWRRARGTERPLEKVACAGALEARTPGAATGAWGSKCALGLRVGEGGSSWGSGLGLERREEGAGRAAGPGSCFKCSATSRRFGVLGSGSLALRVFQTLCNPQKHKRKARKLMFAECQGPSLQPAQARLCSSDPRRSTAAPCCLLPGQVWGVAKERAHSRDASTRPQVTGPPSTGHMKSRSQANQQP